MLLMSNYANVGRIKEKVHSEGIFFSVERILSWAKEVFRKVKGFSHFDKLTYQNDKFQVPPSIPTSMYIKGGNL